MVVEWCLDLFDNYAPEAIGDEYERSSITNALLHSLSTKLVRDSPIE